MGRPQNAYGQRQAAAHHARQERETRTSCLLKPGEDTLMDDKTRAFLLKVQLGQYTGDECRICGRQMTRQALYHAVWAGPSISNAAIAHKKC